MAELIPESRLLSLAVEINIIKERSEKMVLGNFIDLGRRLTEAKNLLKHGEWGKWLQESVGFSQNRA